MRNRLKQIFRDPPVLETERLLLRAMRPDDSSDMFAYARDPAVTRYLTWAPHPDETYTRRYLTYIAGRYRAGEFYDWALILKAENKMIGTCGFTRIDLTARRGEAGYVLNRAYWGRGLAPEALGRVMAFAFDVLGLDRLESRYMQDNTASRRVMEKAGMTFEGFLPEPMIVRGGPVTVGVCAITEAQYRQRQRLAAHANL